MSRWRCPMMRMWSRHSGPPRAFRIATIRVVRLFAVDSGSRCRPRVGYGSPAPSEVAWYVAELDVAGHNLAGVFHRRVGGAVDPLDLERGIERFREGIIEART